MTRPACPTCGARLVEYRFSFNAGLAVFLGRLFDAGGPTREPVRTDDLNLTYAQRTNSQKLRYWGLAEPVITDETVKKRGWWRITQRGQLFVIGRLPIQKQAVTCRNVVLRLEGELIRFADVSEGYQFHGDYVEQVRAQLTPYRQRQPLAQSSSEQPTT